MPTPTTASGKLTRVISNRPSGSEPDSSSSPETTRFVEVPISVSTPPRIAAKLIGMRNGDGERPARRAHATTLGATIATIGVLFRNADESRRGHENPGRAPFGRVSCSLPPAPRMRKVSRSSAPVFSTAAAST